MEGKEWFLTSKALQEDWRNPRPENLKGRVENLQRTLNLLGTWRRKKQEAARYQIEELDSQTRVASFASPSRQHINPCAWVRRVDSSSLILYRRLHDLYHWVPRPPNPPLHTPHLRIQPTLLPSPCILKDSHLQENAESFPTRVLRNSRRKD